MPNDTEAGSLTWGVPGVPSSVAAHWPGIEQGPAALRAAALLETLRAHGVRLADHGDLAVARWTADRMDGRPNAGRQVVDVVDAARSAVSEVVLAGHAPLVLGREWTLAIALVAAFAIYECHTFQLTSRALRTASLIPALTRAVHFGAGPPEVDCSGQRRNRTASLQAMSHDLRQH
jgi:Arginase family